MALEVANVQAVFGFRSTGVPQLVQQTNSATKAMDQLGISGDGAAAQLQLLEVQLAQSNSALAQASAEYEAASNAVLTYADDLAAVSAALKQVETDIAAAEASEDFGEQMKLGQLRVELQRASIDLGTFADAEDRAAKAGTNLTSKLSRQMGVQGRVNRGYEQLAGNSDKAAGKLQTLVRNFSGVQRAARGGVQGISALATSLGRLGIWGAVAAAALLGLFAVFKAFKAVSATSHIKDLSHNMVRLADAANITGSAMKGLLNDTENWLRSIDSSNPEAVAEAIHLQALELTGLAGSYEKALAAVTQYYKSGNSAAAGAAFGFSENDAIQMEKQIQLMSKAEQGSQRYGNMQRWIAENQGRVDKANADQDTSFASLNATVQGLLETIAVAWGPAIEDMVATAEALVIGLTPLVELIAAIGTALADMTNAMLEAAKTTARWGATMLETFSKVASFIPGVDKPMQGMIDSMREWADAGSTLGGISDQVADGTKHVGEQADIARARLEAYFDAANGGMSILKAVRAAGRAALDLEADPRNLEKQIDYFDKYGKVVQAFMQSPGGAQAGIDWAQELGAVELEAVFQNIANEGLPLMEGALGDVGVELKNTVAPLNVMRDQSLALNDAANTATGGVGGLHGALNSLDGTVANTMIYVGVGGPGAAFLGLGGVDFGSMSFANVPSSGTLSSGNISKVAAGNPAKGIPTSAQAAPRTTRQPGMSDRGEAPAVPVSGFGPKDPLTDWLKRQAGPSGSSGGGGGGERDRDLDIDEIRKFIETVNQAVQAGIRGGVVYSTAGNAIPIGGPGEFVKNDGGTNIGTINLRGVWDFADPAAKREIVRQLQEALAQYQKEVA